MNIRFYNARVLTMKDGEELFEGEVWVQDNKIAYVGLGENAPATLNWDREVDCVGNVLMPGFTISLRCFFGFSCGWNGAGFATMQ